MSKPTDKETARVKPFFEDRQVIITTASADSRIKSFTLYDKRTKKFHFFEVKKSGVHAITKAWKQLERKFNQLKFD